MEAIKNAIGLGSTTTTTEQQGREPVNGVTGSGVAGEPYDQGNAEDSTLGGKAPQHTDPSTDYSTNPTISSTPSTTTSGLTSSDAVTPTAASATSPSGPAVDPTSSNTTSGPHASDLANKADPRVDSDNDRHTSSLPGKSTSTSTASVTTEPTTTEQSSKTGGIGSSSWFGTALPIGKGKNTTESSESSPAANVTGLTPRPQHEHSSSTQPSGLEDMKLQPPNTLPANVPTGTSTDFADPGTAPATSIGDISSSNTTDPMHAHQEIPDDTVGNSAPSHALTGSRASIAPTKPDHTNAPLKPAEKGGEHGVNPSAIPTAGGKKIGEDAYTERKSMQADSSPLTTTTNLPTETSTNTARNVGTAEAAGVGAPSGVGQEDKKASVGSGSSASDHKEKKGLVEKIKEKVHHHKEKHSEH